MGQFQRVLSRFAVVFEGLWKIHLELVPVGVGYFSGLLSPREGYFGASLSDWETLEILESLGGEQGARGVGSGDSGNKHRVE